MKKIVILFTSILLLASCGGNKVDRTLRKVAEELNRSCPMMVDADTRLDNCVALPNKTLQYNYTIITVTKDEFVTNLDEIFAPTIINSVRTNPQMESLRKMGVTFGYSYRDRNGEFFWSLQVTPKMYRQE